MSVELNLTASPLSYTEWVKLNENWERIMSGFSNVQNQIRILAGGVEVDEIIARIDAAVSNAETTTSEMQVLIGEVNTKLSEIQTAITNANNAADDANLLNVALTSLKTELEALQTNLQGIVEAESTRVSNEDARISAETNRNAAEQTRISNESDRTAAETTRQQAEQSRVNAETERANTFDLKMLTADEKITLMQDLISNLKSYNYDSGAVYDFPNLITYNGSTFIALQQVSGITPTDDGVNYRLVARKGVDGTGAVSSVNGVLPDENGNVELPIPDVLDNLESTSTTNALSTNQGRLLKTLIDDLGANKADKTALEQTDTNVSNLSQTVNNLGTEVTERLTEMMSLSPSVLKIPLASDYRGWQGVAVYNDLIYVTTDRNENFDLENVISVYSLDGKLISEKRNAYTGLDPQGKFMSFGDINEIDGFLYATVYNFNGGGNPLISRVIKYNIHDLSINQVYEIGENVAESVTKHDNSFWVVYHDIAVVKKFDLNFNFLQEYSLSIQEAIHGYFQGSLWEDNIFYANLHGHNKISDTQPFSKLYKYSFDGTNFNFIEVIEPPTIGCGQGLAKYGDYYFWNDRPNNIIVISKSIRKGNVFPELLPYQNEQSFEPSLLNGWEPYDINYNRPPRITVRDGVVYLSGIAKNIVNANAYDGNTPMFKIPQQYCPKYSINILALSDKGILRVPIVGKNSISPVEQIGDLNLQNIMQYESIGWVSLDGISYPILD